MAQSSAGSSSATSTYDSWRTSDLLPHILDYLAKTQPDALFAEYPVSPDSYDEGYRSITYRALANAVNGLSWWIQENLGKPTRPGYEIIAYIGPNDLRYPVSVLAAIKTGYVLFLPSPHKGVSVHKRLLKDLGCTNILAPASEQSQVEAILKQHEMRNFIAPSVEHLLKGDYEEFPYMKEYVEELHKPLFIIHTSGTTGFPKPLIYKHSTATANTKLMTLEPPAGFESVQKMFEGKRMFLTFPPFHAVHLVMLLFNCLPLGTVYIAPPAGATSSAQSLFEGLKRSPADIAFLEPSTILELARDPEILDFCSQHIDMMIFSGGEIPQDIGDVVASKVKLVNQYVTSELGICSQLESSENYDYRDWNYMQFNPKDGHKFHHVVEDAYEYRVLHIKEFETQQPTSSIFPGTAEFRSRDLFVKHPTKPDTWTWKARTDDVIVLLSGQKMIPISIEQQLISRGSEVNAAMVIGSYRFQAALILEPKSDKLMSPKEKALFIEEAWPSVEQVNRISPRHARISKSHILATIPGKPIFCIGKSAIRRQATVAQYSREIDNLYAEAEKSAAPFVGEIPDVMFEIDDEKSVNEVVKKTMATATGWADWDSFANDDDLFELGLESSEAMTALRMLRQILGLANLTLSTIYAYPSIGALTKAVISLSKHQQASEAAANDARLVELNDTLREFAYLINDIPAQPATVSYAPEEHCIILTGSTGTLGSYLLSALLSESSVGHIYCFNRAADSGELQAKRNRTRGLPTTFQWERVTFVTVDLAAPTFNLPLEFYERLLSSVTLIVHAAWPVDHDLPLPAFRPSLHGLVSLINFANSAYHKPHLHFLSSTSAVMSSSCTKKPSSLPLVAEHIFSPIATPLPNGYAESKHVGEVLLAHASVHLSLSLSLSRIGQIAGAADRPGLWNPAEWFPSLVLSSAYLGVIPESLGSLERIDWLPIDKLAGVLVELVLTVTKTLWEGEDVRPNVSVKNNPDAKGSAAVDSEVLVFHPRHFTPTTWARMLPFVLSALNDYTLRRLRMVSPEEWIDLVRKDMQFLPSSITQTTDSPTDDLTPLLKDPDYDAEADLAARLKRNPAARLLTFYESSMGASSHKSAPLLPHPEVGETAAGMEVVLAVKQTLAWAGLRLVQVEELKKGWVKKWVWEWMDWRKGKIGGLPSRGGSGGGGTREMPIRRRT